MTNAERIQANNAELREAIDLAESLPNARSDEETIEMITTEIAMGTLIEAKSTEATKMRAYAFYQQSLLESLDLPNVTAIESNAFFGCSSLASVNIPKVTSLADNTFRECTALVSVDIPLCSKGGNYTFYGCNLLTEANVPLLSLVGTSMFYNCKKLVSIDCPLATEVGGSAFFQNTALTSANLPLVTKVGNYAFQYCYNLATAVFNSLKTVGNSAFYGCDVAIYDSPFESISASAFYNNTYLKAFVVRNTATVCTLANANAFSSTKIASGTGYIYVPSALVDSYKTATNWSTYASQFRALEDYTVDGTVTGALDESKI